MQRVVTVTPNAAIDSTWFLGELRPGTRQLARAGSRQAGGKGVNVSRVLAALGVAVRSVVVVGGETGAEIERDLSRSRLEPIVVQSAGESRTCLEIIEKRSGTATQLHAAGVDADPGTGDALVAAVSSALEGATWLALCGSLPPGLPADVYATLIRVARERRVRVALDASGAALLAGWNTEPDVVRINREEATALPGGFERARAGVVSDGPRAILAWSHGRSWRVVPPRARVRNPIGCGDAMLAGLLARIDGNPFEDALRFATALACADAESPVAGRPDLARAQEQLANVELQTLVPEPRT